MQLELLIKYLFFVDLCLYDLQSSSRVTEDFSHAL